jgi:hypothetical protein
VREERLRGYLFNKKLLVRAEFCFNFASMPGFIHHIQHGQFRYQDKIYIWVFSTETGKLTVKNAGEDLFTIKPMLKTNREVIKNDYVLEKIENFLRCGTPTPELNNSDPFDGIDFVPE